MIAINIVELEFVYYRSTEFVATCCVDEPWAYTDEDVCRICICIPCEASITDTHDFAAEGDAAASDATQAETSNG